MPLPTNHTVLSNEPFIELGWYDIEEKDHLLTGVGATFVGNRLIVFRANIKSSAVTIEEAREKFESKYEKRFEPIQILIYSPSGGPDLNIIKTPVDCLVLFKNGCSISLNYSPPVPGFNIDRRSYSIRLQDDHRIKELENSTNASISNKKQTEESARKKKATTIVF